MGTDTALAMAIAHVWIIEDTYDKEYVADRTIGFDEFKPYVLGETDGVPKTPEWAAEESGVEARVIRTLAREWAAKRTILSAGARGGEGSACRTAYGTEWARMMVLLQAMQGLGKPGITIWGVCHGRARRTSRPGSRPTPTSGPHVALDEGRRLHPAVNSTKQRLYRLTVPDAILDPPVELGRRRLLRPVARAAVRALRVPDRGLLRDQALLPVRRLVHGHHVGHHEVGAHVPEPQARVRRQSGRLVQQRDPHGGRHPAGLHQLRARRHRRVRRLRRLHHELAHGQQLPRHRP